MNLTDRRAVDAVRAALVLFVTAAVFLMSPAVTRGQSNGTGAEGNDGQQEAFQRLKQRFEEGDIFTAQFTHAYVDSFTGDSTSDSGRIWVGRQRYKVQTENETVVVDGETSRVYDRNRNRVIVSNYEPEDDDFAPSRILNGVDSTFTVDTQEQRDGREYILLTSDDPFAMYQQVEIWLTPGLVPLSIRAIDPADNIITTRFSDGSFTRPDSALFRLDYPDNAEVIDMRN